jgi:hypothetical protein
MTLLRGRGMAAVNYPTGMNLGVIRARR